MNIAASIAHSGIRANLTRMDASASKIARQSGDPIDSLVEQLTIKASFEANVAVLKTTGEMERGAIRLWA